MTAIRRGLVGLERLAGGGVLALVARGELGEVTVVIAHPAIDYQNTHVT